MFADNIRKKIAAPVKKIAEHPLFRSIHTIEELCIFTEHHVFAVWDFMCLLKGLQRELTCTTLPWLPPKSGLGAHLVNVILADEEGDTNENGQYMSHFEIYLDAMQAIGANTSVMNEFIAKLVQKNSLEKSLQMESIPYPARMFVKSTFEILSGNVHQMASAFLFGREDITAKMFTPILENLKDATNEHTQKIHYYFKRHIELDEADHSHKAALLLDDLCKDDEAKWLDVEKAALFALEARYCLLEGIYQALKTHRTKKVNPLNQMVFN